MVWRLMPAARATSASVIADQPRLSSSSRIASSTESRRRARDASAYGTLLTFATVVGGALVTNERLPPSRSRISLRRSPGSSSLRGCHPSGCRARCRLPASLWPRRTQSRTARTRTVCSHSFRCLQQLSDSPPQAGGGTTSRAAARGRAPTSCRLRHASSSDLQDVEVDLFAYRAVGAAPVFGYLLPAGSGWKSFSCSAFGVVVHVVTARAAVDGHHAT